MRLLPCLLTTSFALLASLVVAPLSPLPDHGKVASFLLSGLRVSQERYAKALEDFNSELSTRFVRWEDLPEDLLDLYAAEYVIELFESDNGAGIGKAATTIAAIAKVRPRFRFTTAWKCLDVWRVKVPPVQARAFPPEFAQALAIWLVLQGQFIAGTVIILCFAGLFRASELLKLPWECLVASTTSAVFILGVTKRGMEQKVVITNISILSWLHCYLIRIKASGSLSKKLVFPISLTKLNYWIRKGMTTLQLGEGWTSHGLRRGGATELYRLNFSIEEIAQFGRWLSIRSLREYLRKGEVALRRAACTFTADAWNNVRNLAARSGDRWLAL